MNTKTIAMLGLSAFVAVSAYALTEVPAGPISVNTSWTTAGSPYILHGPVFVDSGATLDIAPGVIVRGQPISDTGLADPGVLLITRDGKIQARGTATSPIIFTTAVLDAGLVAGGAATGIAYDGPDGNTVPDEWVLADGETKWLDMTPATIPLRPVNPAGAINSKLWGGVIICGFAPTNSNTDVSIPADGVPEANQGFVEGLSATPQGRYGGDDAFDNSGIFRFVSIRHGGFSLAPASEVNGLTLYGVGRGTSIDHVEVYCNVDDGIEVFGGTVDLSFLSIAFAEDDGFDTDQGYQGTAQFIYVLHGMTIGATTMISSGDPRGMELDGDDAPGNVVPGGLPFEDTRIYNATIQTFNTQGAFMRNGFAGSFVNSIISNHAASAFVGLTVSTGGTVSPQVAYDTPALRLQVRNTTFNGWTTSSNAWVGSIPFEPHTNTGHAATVFYPATVNSTLTADMLTPTYAAGGVNPRPGAGPGTPSVGATGATQASAYVTSPAVATTYRGAFLGTAPTLWTTGWTALNKTNTEGIKLLVD